MMCGRVKIGMFLLLGLFGCAGTGDEPRANTTESAVPDDMPAPVASLHLSNGNDVHFYDFGVGALVTETGQAYTTPALDETDIPASELVNVWNRLAPQEPAPKALIALRDRLTEASVGDGASQPPVSLKVDHGTAADQSGSATEGATADENASPRPIKGALRIQRGCSNGCCDQEWLSTLSTCFYTGWDYRWSLYNGGYSWANTNNIWHMRGLVCSASGTSSWVIGVGGKAYGIQVAEATYYNWSWTASSSIWCAGYCASDMTSTVNSASNQHLHAYCGMVQKD